MQNCFIVSALQHGRRENPLLLYRLESWKKQVNYSLKIHHATLVFIRKSDNIYSNHMACESALYIEIKTLYFYILEMFQNYNIP